MPPTKLPLRAVAALYLKRQHLARPRARKVSAARLSAFAEDVGGIQLDSINVVERAHYLTLWSRFGPYSKTSLDRWVYGRRLLFEYWAHAACLVPADHLIHWRRAMLDYGLHHRGWRKWLRKNDTVLRKVEAAIRERGPLGNGDFHRPARQRGTKGWWSWKPATFALDYLWMRGETMVHSRVHFQKRFDLTERVHPNLGTLEPASTEEFRSWHVRRALHAMGAATEAHLRGYLTFPRSESAERRRMLHQLVREGEVVECAVEGSSRAWFALRDDLPALGAAADGRQPSRGTTLLSPFDSFLWDRARVAELFGFNYRIEVYTPGDKRRFGYYTLPIFHDGQLIGRLDPKTHREVGRLELRNVHLEDWFAKGAAAPAARWRPIDRDAALAGLARAIWSLARFVGAEEVTVAKVSPSRLAAPVKRAVRAAEAVQDVSRSRTATPSG